MFTLPPGIWKILRAHRFLFFGPVGVAAIILIIVWASRADFFADILSGESGLVKAMHWLADNLFLFVVLLLFLSVFIPVCFWGFYTKGLHKKFEREWERAKTQRQTLRDLIYPAYGKWRSAPSSVDIVDRFVEKVGFPDGLPFEEGEIREYASRARDTWGGYRKQLLDFCIAIYPSGGKPSLLESD